MDTRRLKSFLKIVDTGSLTRAAAALKFAQPAIRHQLLSLEEHCPHNHVIRSQPMIALDRPVELRSAQCCKTRTHHTHGARTYRQSESRHEDSAAEPRRFPASRRASRPPRSDCWGS